MISIIVAIDRNNAIGRNNDIPWHISADLKRFKSITMGHTVMMGRNTWESLPFKPLKGRRNIVISKSMTAVEGMEVAKSVDEAIRMVNDEDVFVIGGEQIYSQTIGHADRLIVTHVDIEAESADRFFPAIDMNIWKAIDESPFERECGLGYRYVTYERR